MMKVNLCIDGNYLLNRLVFTLHKNNLLFGSLQKSLEISISGYRMWYPFNKIYLVSDSKEKSWRKKLNKDYKSNRKKNSDIDWDFVFKTYDDFKNSLKNKGVSVLETPYLEGDDWLSFICENSNKSGISTIIISNDYDIKQLINYSIDPLWINIMSNEMYNKQKLFLPKNYQIFINNINKIDDDIFNLNDNQEFLNLLTTFINKYDVNIVDSMESLFIKIISGDASDNISSVWSIVKNGKRRGIADKGAKTIFDDYVENFGEPNLTDPDLTENIADIICEKKKLPKNEIINIKSNIENNMKLILLGCDYLPKEVVKRMEIFYEKVKI